MFLQQFRRLKSVGTTASRSQKHLFVVEHGDMIIKSTFRNTMFGTQLTVILEHSCVMNAFNVVPGRYSADKSFGTNATRINVILVFWYSYLVFDNKLK